MALEIIPGSSILQGLGLAYFAGETKNLADGTDLEIFGTPTITTDGAGVWLNCPTLADRIRSTGGQFVTGANYFCFAVKFRVKDLYPSGGGAQYLCAQSSALFGNASWTRLGFTAGSQTERAWVNYRVSGGTQFTSGTIATVRTWGVSSRPGSDLERFNGAEGALPGGASVSVTGRDGDKVWIGANVIEGYGSDQLEIDYLLIWPGIGLTAATNAPTEAAWRAAVDNARSFLQTVGGGGGSAKGAAAHYYSSLGG